MKTQGQVIGQDSSLLSDADQGVDMADLIGRSINIEK